MNFLIKMEKLNIFKNNYQAYLKNVLNIGLKLRSNYEVRNLRINKDQYFISLSTNVKDIFNYGNKNMIENIYISEDKIQDTITIEENPGILFYTNYEKDRSLEIKIIKNQKNDKETFFEIWNIGVLIHSLKLEDSNIKFIYTDNIFGKPKFSPDGKNIIFLAEFDKSKEFKNYFSIDNNKINENMNKFIDNQDFGEMLDDKTNPQICIYNIEEKKIYHVDLSNYPNIFPSCPIFDNKKNIIFAGFDFPNIKLGLVYCLKRKSSIYLIKDPVMKEINKNDSVKENFLINLIENRDYTNIYPLFSQNFKKLIFFSNEKSIPHMNGLKLNLIEWDDNLDTFNPSIIIDKIKAKNDYFNSIYAAEDSIINTSFFNEDLLVFNSENQAKTMIYIYDISKNFLSEIPYEYNYNKLIEVRENHIISINSDINKPHLVTITKFNRDEYEKCIRNANSIILENGVIFKEIKSNTFTKTIIISDYNHQYLNLVDVDKHILTYKQHINQTLINTKVKDLYYDNVYGHLIYTNNSNKMPLVYYLHGGPNSILSKLFILSQLLFLANGYSILVINYQGSIGYGQEYLSKLVGNIGELDVKVCGEFLKSTINDHEFIDQNNIMLYGGSHGGFLSCWLSVHEKYSNMFSSAVIRNPVTDLCSMMGTTDIPDWVLGQSLSLDINDNYTPSRENYEEFWNKSPIFKSKNCITPMLIMLGKCDKRVKYYNGLYLYNSLKINGCKVKLLVYPKDTHPLSSPETEIDSLFNTMNWFEEHRK